MKAIKTISYRGKEIEIHQDDDAQSPQEDGDNGLFLVANHRDFYVPEPGEKRITDDFQTIVERYRKTHWVFPLEAYIHSGVVLALSGCGNFPDRQWDVSQLGAVFAAKKEWRLSKAARKAAESYVETWNQYLGGEVYGYVVGDDSCWGFYGMEYCIQEAKSAADYQVEQERKAKLAQVKTWIKNHVPLSIRQAQIRAAN